MVGFLLGEAKPACEPWFDWPRPEYYARFGKRLPKVRYSMPSVRSVSPPGTAIARG